MTKNYFWRIGAKLILCSGEGPNFWIASRWAAVPYPLLVARSYSGYFSDREIINLSLWVLARIDAAAIDRDLASPFTSLVWGRGLLGKTM